MYSFWNMHMPWLNGWRNGEDGRVKDVWDENKTELSQTIELRLTRKSVHSTHIHPYIDVSFRS